MNGATAGSYSITTLAAALKSVNAERSAAKKRIATLKGLKADIRRGDFDKRDKRYLVALYQSYYPSAEVKDTRTARIAAADAIIGQLNTRIQILAGIAEALRHCGKTVSNDKSVAKYGKFLPVVAKPVVVPGSAAYNYREAYVGYLVSVAQDVNINNSDGRKVGTRSGYLSCMKNMKTGATYYRIFDDQPCEEAEGGVTGGNTSLDFADLDACKKLVPEKSWATFGASYAVSPPTEENITNSFAFLIGGAPTLFRAVFLSADPQNFDGTGVGLDEFKSWCASQAWQ